MSLRYLVVGLGGAIGAIARVSLEKILPLSVMGIPFYILGINILGCFVMGVLTELMGLYWATSANMRYFLISGILGGFTTFSAFALEFGLLYEKHQYILAITYAILSLTLTIFAFFIGMASIRLFH